jgi:thiamine phosphate synthase YjbQ (UPF0047 family)
MKSFAPIFGLELNPARRNQVTDLRPSLDEAVARGDLPPARHLLCISHHTTAGFPDRRLRLRLGSDPDRLRAFLEGLQDVFPREAGYEHDKLDRRTELSASQREREPLNADAHLAFIGGGFTNCVLHVRTGDSPVWFVDFDGTYETRTLETLQRRRHVTVIAVDDETEVARLRFQVPVPEGAAAVPLDAPDLGIIEAVEQALQETRVRVGRIRIRLDEPRLGAGITVNEAEALLMDRDLVDVLAHPLRFAHGSDADRDPDRDANPGARANGRTTDPRAPAAAAGLDRALEALSVSPDRRRRLLGRALSSPSPRILRMRPEGSLAVVPGSGDGRDGPGRILVGRYQSPILVQRSGLPERVRGVSVVLLRFD